MNRLQFLRTEGIDRLFFVISLQSQYGAMEWFYDPENTTDPRCAVILTLASGILLLIMSVFKLGFLVNYVSHAVICGFTCAASIIIAFSQVKKLLGLKGVR